MTLSCRSLPTAATFYRDSAKDANGYYAWTGTSYSSSQAYTKTFYTNTLNISTTVQLYEDSAGTIYTDYSISEAVSTVTSASFRAAGSSFPSVWFYRDYAKDANGYYAWSGSNGSSYSGTKYTSTLSISTSMTLYRDTNGTAETNYSISAVSNFEPVVSF